MAVRAVAVDVVFVALGHAGRGAHALAAFEPDHMDALCVAAGDAHAFDCEANYLTAVGYQHHLIVDSDLADADYFAGFFGQVHGDDALAAAMSQPVVRCWGALAVTQFRDCEQRFVVAHRGHRNDFVLDQGDGLALFDRLRFEFHPDHAAGRAAHRARLLFLETNRLSFACREHNLLIAIGDPNVNQGVAVFEIDRNNSVR